jgi:hypothetical protein
VDRPEDRKSISFRPIVKFYQKIVVKVIEQMVGRIGDARKDNPILTLSTRCRNISHDALGVKIWAKSGESA